MKVIIFTEGGNDIGLGHISRCRALYDEIEKRKIEVKFIIFGDFIDTYILKDIDFINEDWSNIRFLESNIETDDFAIVDSYRAKTPIYDMISKLSKKVMFIDDFGRLDYPEGIILNPSLDSSTIDYSKCCNNIVLSGPDYVILREQFRNIKREYFSEEVKRILIIMGGTDLRELIPIIIDSICKNMPNKKFDVIIGKNYDDNFIKTLSNIKNISFYKNINANQMIELMGNADLAITAAGQTIYELLATQTPFIPIQIIENQENNIRSLLKYNPKQPFLKYGEYDLVGQLVYLLERYELKDYRKNQIDKFGSIVDGYGVTRIIDFLLKKNENTLFLREIKPDDIKEVYDLSNQDYVRCYSLNKNRIKWDEHKKWFNSVIKDKSTVFYVVSDYTESFLGQVRFNISSKSATISISLSKKIIGKGLSKQILYQSIKKVFEDDSSLTNIIAVVSLDNKASLKIFRELKFKPLKYENNTVELVLNKEVFDVN